ncbi:MAG: 50S ribosomal protein L3 N(5)-glutamine methyltransferase [Proteobacteria bacterium]|nr:50S ribosomal protein L3 N(5)-glutamine methyltransferase [Pseudomonadota bacterium]
MSASPLLDSLPAERELALLSIGDWIRAIASEMSRMQTGLGQGVQTHWDDARWLVLGGLALPVETSEPLESLRLLPAEKLHLWMLTQRRIQMREPTAYILGAAMLRGHRFRSDPRAIIPRSLLAEFLSPADIPGQHKAPATILDLCTGGGSLAILAALAYPEAEVLAVDISPAALELAAENLHDFGLTDRVRLVQSDLFYGLPSDSRFDLILCNPPYVPTASIDAAPEEFGHEPRLALEAGDDGMQMLRRLLAQCPGRLRQGGQLLVEVGLEYKNTMALFEQAFPALEPIWLQTEETTDQVFMLTGDTR